jgi:hypothetical protein
MDQPARGGARKTATRHGCRAPPGAIVSKLGLASHLTRRRAAGCASRLTFAAPFG